MGPPPRSGRLDQVAGLVDLLASSEAASRAVTATTSPGTNLRNLRRPIATVAVRGDSSARRGRGD
jgi:hypothetical protein